MCQAKAPGCTIDGALLYCFCCPMTALECEIARLLRREVNEND